MKIYKEISLETEMGDGLECTGNLNRLGTITIIKFRHEINDNNVI